jgi:hypothetical protein
MATLKINCYCSEEQMQIIIDRVLHFISIHDIDDLPDFDDTIEGVRVCVDFNYFLGKISIKESGAEILNSDWDILNEDTAVFSSRLKEELEKLNIENEKRYRQALEIAKEERQGLLNPYNV